MADSNVSHSLIVTHQSSAEVRRDNGCCLFSLAFHFWVLLQRSFYSRNENLSSVYPLAGGNVEAAIYRSEIERTSMLHGATLPCNAQGVF